MDFVSTSKYVLIERSLLNDIEKFNNIINEQIVKSHKQVIMVESLSRIFNSANVLNNIVNGVKNISLIDMFDIYNEYFKFDIPENSTFIETINYIKNKFNINTISVNIDTNEILNEFKKREITFYPEFRENFKAMPGDSVRISPNVTYLTKANIKSICNKYFILQTSGVERSSIVIDGREHSILYSNETIRISGYARFEFSHAELVFLKDYFDIK